MNKKGKFIMKKRVTAIILTLVVLLCFSMLASASIQGRYLRNGSCALTAGTGYVYVKGETYAYEDVESITVELELYKEKTSDVWVKVWSDSKTATNDNKVKYSKTKVTVDSGYNYKIVSTHSIENGSYNESNDNESPVYYVD